MITKIRVGRIIQYILAGIGILAILYFAGDGELSGKEKDSESGNPKTFERP